MIRADRSMQARNLLTRLAGFTGGLCPSLNSAKGETGAVGVTADTVLVKIARPKEPKSARSNLPMLESEHWSLCAQQM
jgi:hypothetical protein